MSVVCLRGQATLLECQTRYDVLDVMNLLDVIEWGNEIEAVSAEEAKSK